MVLNKKSRSTLNKKRRMKTMLNGDYSTQQVNKDLMVEILTSLKNIHWGSIEIYIQDSQVIQITERHIKKMKGISDNSVSKSKKIIRNENGS